ncbi:MAG: T9SS type A sorting domain-containing protein [Parafilimonas sp.]
MKKFVRTIKTICLLMIFKASFFGNANAQVLYHEGFEGDSIAGKKISFSASKWKILPGGFNSYKGDVCAYVTTDSYNENADCWLITDKIHFKAGKKYSISFYYKCQTNQDNQLQVSIGKNVIASEGEIVWDKSFHNDSYLKGQVNYTASVSGNETVAFHCVTAPTMQTYLYLDEITVAEVTCFEPLNISFTNTTSTSITAGWDKVDGAAYYEYSVLGKDTTVPRNIKKAYNNTVSLTGLEPASTNYFYVRSRCSDTDSSSWATAKYNTNYDCSTFANLNCGEYFQRTYRGSTGLYPVSLCGGNINGPEFFHKFTPSQSGYYKLDCFSSGGNGVPMSFSYKSSSYGCGNDNWNCIGIMFDFSTAVFGPLNAGEEYIIMEKSALEAGGLPSNYNFEIECYTPPPANDKCSDATEITVTDYNERCTGTPLTTAGATADNLGSDDYNSCGAYASSNDDDIWIKFKATDNVQLFRFSNTSYNKHPYLLEVNFYSSPCNAASLIDCGEIKTSGGDYKDIVSYYFTKGKTYWCRLSTAGINNSARFNLCIMKPAIVTSSADTCKQGLRQPLQDKDKNIWVPMLDNSLQLVGAINFGDNIPSSALPSVFINHADLRQDNTGRYYLDRNFAMLSRPKITSPVTVRLYISKDELNKLIAQNGSEVTSIKDIRVTQVNGTCAPLGSKTGTFIVPDKTGDYDANNKYIEFKTNQLSSFFLHGGSTALNSNSGLVSDATASVLNGALKVSPNPFTDIIHIETNEHASAEYSVSVITMNGQVLANYKKIVSPGKSYLSINLSTLSAGVYTLKIEKQSGTEFRKIVKH